MQACPPSDWQSRAAELRALADKYRTLASLRRARAAGAPPPSREFFAALARRFPGALRELDTVGLEQLDARAEALELALAGGPVAGWIPLVLGYHAWMRAALWLKPRLARGTAGASAQTERWRSELHAQLGLAVDADFVLAVAQPPEGRLTPLVLARVAAAGGVDVAAVRAAVFASPVCDGLEAVGALRARDAQ